MADESVPDPAASGRLAPLCFVLMPFGRKTDASGRTTHFDAVYQQIIAPAIAQAGLEPIRADEEKVGGTIHKPMFERLMLCPYAVADITGANPNVYYELGIRHALRPRATVILFAEGTTLPFDVAPLRGLPYQIDARGEPVSENACIERIASQLRAARSTPQDDSPLFQLIIDLPRPGEVAHSVTDEFHRKYAYSKIYKERLQQARLGGEVAVRNVAADPGLENLVEVEVGVIVDLFLAYRDVKAYSAMVDLFHQMPEPLKRTRVIREQYAFALNRLGDTDTAERVLREVIREFGPSSETNGLLGRIYKDRWEHAHANGKQIEAQGLLRKAIDSYLEGFQTDWRDAYPGVNAVTLMELLPKADARQAEILPVVRYSAAQKARVQADYWDHATLLELSVLARDEDAAAGYLADVLASASPTAPWQLETTVRNLRLIRETRQRRGEFLPWLNEIEEVLQEKAKEFDSANQD